MNAPLTYFIYSLDDGFKGSAVAWDVLNSPARPDGTKRTPFQHVLDTDEDLFGVYSLPENQYKMQRFNIAMKGTRAFQPSDAILNGELSITLPQVAVFETSCFPVYPWQSLPSQAVVIDVGGGIGTSALQIARRNRDLKVIVQDIPIVIEQAKEVSIALVIPPAWYS